MVVRNISSYCEPHSNSSSFEHETSTQTMNDFDKTESAVTALIQIFFQEDGKYGCSRKIFFLALIWSIELLLRNKCSFIKFIYGLAGFTSFIQTV